MTYEAVLTQVRNAPEACLDKISDYINYVVYQYNQKKLQEAMPTPELNAAMLEALQISADKSVKGYSDTKELFAELNK